MVCEQVNFLLGRLKHQTKHMNCDRFHAYLYIITNKMNHLKITNRINDSTFINLKKNRRL